MSGNWTPHKARVAADFGAAAGSYDGAARLQRNVLELLLARISTPLPSRPVTSQHLTPARSILDLGCGTGLALPQLARIFPDAQLLALDLAEGMVRHARGLRTEGGPGRQDWVVGDAEALPLASASVDVIFSSLAVQWCENTSQLFDELARVLQPGGRLLLSTLVEGTLFELEAAWQEVDPGQAHVNRFLTSEALAAEVHRAFPGAVIDIVPIRLRYADLLGLLRELKNLGARYKNSPRRRGATAPSRLRQLERSYARYRDHAGFLPATYNVALIQV